MKARFEQEGHNDVIIVLEPETEHERLLLAATIGYDANVANFSVDRYENGQIERLRILPTRNA